VSLQILCLFPFLSADCHLEMSTTFALYRTVTDSVEPEVNGFVGSSKSGLMTKKLIPTAFLPLPDRAFYCIVTDVSPIAYVFLLSVTSMCFTACLPCPQTYMAMNVMHMQCHFISTSGRSRDNHGIECVCVYWCVILSENT